jgi:hypothetical protein
MIKGYLWFGSFHCQSLAPLARAARPRPTPQSRSPECGVWVDVTTGPDGGGGGAAVGRRRGAPAWARARLEQRPELRSGKRVPGASASYLPWSLASCLPLPRTSSRLCLVGRNLSARFGPIESSVVLEAPHHISRKEGDGHWILGGRFRSHDRQSVVFGWL